MRRMYISLIIIIAIIGFSFNLSYAVNNVIEMPNIKIIIDNKLGTYSNVPIIANGRTLLPLREVLVNLGIPNDNDHIIWNGNDSSVIIKKNSTVVFLKVGDNNASVNGKATTLDAAPINYKNRVYIPARFVAQSFDMNVEWDSYSKSVVIRNEEGYNRIRDILRTSRNSMLSLSKYKSTRSGYVSLSDKNGRAENNVHAMFSIDNENRIASNTMEMNITQNGKRNNIVYDSWYTNNNSYSRLQNIGDWDRTQMTDKSRETIFDSYYFLQPENLLCAGLDVVDNKSTDDIVLKSNVCCTPIVYEFALATNISNVTIHNFSIEIYFDKETYFVKKMNYSFNGVGDTYLGKETFSTEVSWENSDYNGTFKLELPSEVSAIEKIPSINVSNADEFVKAIGSNRRIILDPGVYNLSEAEKNDSIDGTVFWKKVYDGEELNIQDITNLTIEGSLSEKSQIIVSPRYAEILSFINSNDITIRNIEAKHESLQYECDAGVSHFENCNDVSVCDSELYGCGSIGISIKDSFEISCDNVEIRSCSLRAIQVIDSESIRFNLCRIWIHNAYSNIIYTSGANDVSFYQCTMSNNNNFGWSFIEAEDGSDILIDKCIITNNSVTKNLVMKHEKVYFFNVVDYFGNCDSTITVNNSEISNNKCDYLTDSTETVKFNNCIMNNNVWGK